MTPPSKETAENRQRIDDDRLHVSISDLQRVKRKQRTVTAQEHIEKDAREFNLFLETNSQT